MEYRDYYKILGVDKNSSEDDIKKKYRRLARKYHPDVSKEKNAEEKFKEVQEAYEVLKDPAKKAAYDQLGNQAHARPGPGFSPPPGWEFRQSGAAAENPFAGEGYSDFFETLFGQQAQRQRHANFKQRGQDQHSKIELSLEEAFSGAQRLIQFQEPTLDPQTGQVTLKTRSLNVKIPAGITSGQQIRLSGQGGPGVNQGPNGDLYLEIQIKEHPFYTVKNRDIYLQCPVTPWEAALGAKLTVPTLGGAVEVNVPAKSQSGKKLRLKGRGFPGSPAGDQYILLSIDTPAPQNESQRQLYQKMAEEMGDYNPRQILYGAHHE